MAAIIIIRVMLSATRRFVAVTLKPAVHNIQAYCSVGFWLEGLRGDRVVDEGFRGPRVSRLWVQHRQAACHDPGGGI